MYRIAICEDDRNYIEYLKKVVADADIVSKENILFFDFISGEQIVFSEEWNFDLVIMDVQLNKLNGYEAAMRLKEKRGYALLVFCSGAVMPSDESFKAAPYRYLLKSYSDERMLEEMQDILQEMVRLKERPYIMCKYTAKKDMIRVSAEEILYISIRHDGSKIHIWGKLREEYTQDELWSNLSLNELSQVFKEEYGFVRAHNSYLVNMAHIVRTQGNSVFLKDGTQLNVSRSRVQEFQKAFAKFMAAKYMR